MAEEKSLVSVIIVSALVGFLAGGGSALVVVNQKIASSHTTVPGTTIKVNEESATIDVVKKVTPAVVTIIVSKDISAQQIPLFFGSRTVLPGTPGQKQRIAGGSGFIVSSDGMILTNRHVVQDEQADYTVIFSDGTQKTAKVLGRDPLNDLALVKVDAKNLPTVELGDSDSIQIGQDVIAIGFALGEYQNTVTKGIISGINRKVVAGDAFQSGIIEGALQTDAAINEGNSGGPLLNEAGQVIGINTAVSLEGQLIGFAIPVNAARIAIDSFNAHGRIVRPWLGIRYVPLTEDLAKANNLPLSKGAYIVPGQPNDPGVVKGSPADKAGLKEKDIVTEINGTVIDETTSLAELISKHQVGELVTLKVRRGNDTIEIKVTLEEIKK